MCRCDATLQFTEFNEGRRPTKEPSDSKKIASDWLHFLSFTKKKPRFYKIQSVFNSQRKLLCILMFFCAQSERESICQLKKIKKKLCQVTHFKTLLTPCKLCSLYIFLNATADILITKQKLFFAIYLFIYYSLLCLFFGFVMTPQRDEK